MLILIIKAIYSYFIVLQIEYLQFSFKIILTNIKRFDKLRVIFYKAQLIDI